MRSALESAKIAFVKYSGCGNDFIIVESPPCSMNIGQFAAALCSRKQGIGADGLIVLSPAVQGDFKIAFFNADGSEAEMCGNGARAAVHYFHAKNPIKYSYTFETKERLLQAEIHENAVAISMGDVLAIELKKELMIDKAKLPLVSMNTGVPHALLFTNDLETIDIEAIGKKVRHHPRFAPAGTNFSAVKMTEEEVLIRTYERGVEAETLACGTGATAAAIAAALLFSAAPPVKVKVRSGDTLTIDFSLEAGKPSGVKLSGPCHEVFRGEIALQDIRRFQK
ncbi:diaminopimelate epimerase [Estrella lausannensis]|uniref:Diaminopimelate epimerase n=1 Tax=Estrella lausannensis TaxID=483423 RepID=A0A0H5DPT3_9BACT|nr:diaminopimelate epimerase [Estrella lausannensis]CRX38576.1 Diaminopimelate epimerase [Estrella lausannensis]